jgi:hypothetical protein
MSDCCNKLMARNIHVSKKTIETCLMLRALGKKFRLNCDNYENSILEANTKFNFSPNINETKSI